MSREIDERIVSMQFNNANFEKNVRTTMNSLDNLDKKLKLKGASKGLTDVGKASDKVTKNVTGVGGAAEAVSLKFSALQVVGLTALTRIANQAVATGERMLKALTLDPITTGFKEYETQINAVQTILANTSSKGTTIDQVNAALDELNRYADKTIYNFTEMTRNIGTFTAAGVDLDTSVSAIQGIANLAAVSGSTSQQASTAMYQLSQALAAGKVSLMDWNSVVNAGMGGEVFQNALRRTSEMMGTGAEAAIKKYGSFRESLTKGEWLTTDVLTKTLEQFTMAAEEGTKEWETFKKSLMDDGYTEKQAEEILKMANTATDAATKVKTFSQLWDVMKESAQSGWAQTWKLIIGDFEEAKALLTPLADFFTNVINKMSDARNKLLEGALGKSFTHLMDKFNTVAEPAKKAVKAIEDLGAIVDKVILGSFGNGAERIEKLTNAGYNYYKVQNKVNEKLGNSFRYSNEMIESQEKSIKTGEKLTETTKEMDKADAALIARLARLSDEQLKNEGYTNTQIDAIRQLQKEAEKTGIPLHEFIENLDKINGRYLLIEGFKNIGEGIGRVFTAIGKAWKSVFPPVTSEQLYNVIAGFHKLTLNLEGNSNTTRKLMKTFKGLFAALDIVLTVVSGPLKIAFKILKQLLGAFDLDILDVTAKIGDLIVKFRDWIDSTLDFTAVFEKIAPPIKNAIKFIKEWIKGLKETDNVAEYIGTSLGHVINAIRDAFSKAKEFIKGGFLDGGADFISGFVNGIQNGIGKVVSKVIEFGSEAISALKKVLDSHSPSKKTEQIGQDFMLGFFNGAVEFSYKVWNWIKDFFGNILDYLKTIDLGSVAAVFIGASSFRFLGKIVDVVNKFASPFEGLGDIFESVADVVKKAEKVVTNFAKIEKAFAKTLKAKALKDMAIGIAILAGALIVLSFVPWPKLAKGVITIAALAGVLALLSWGLTKIGGADGKGALKGAGLLMSFGLVFLMLAGTIKILETVDPEKMNTILYGLGGMIAALASVMLLVGGLGSKFKGDTEKTITQIGKMFVKLGIAMLLMVGVMKLINTMTPEEIVMGGAVIIALSGLFVGLTAMTKLAGTGTTMDKLGGMFVKMAIAMGLMVAVIKLINTISPAELVYGGIVIIGMSAIMVGLTAMTRLAGGNDSKHIGGTLFKMAIGIGILALIVKMFGSMETENIIKGELAVAGLAVIIAGLVAATRLAGKDLKGIGTTMLAMATAIGILGLTVTILGLLSIEHLAKGIIAVGMLGGIMALMIHVTKDAKSIKSELIVMTTAIGVMAVAIAALSFIEPGKLAGATAAIGLVMGMFALIISQGKHATGSLGTLIVMTTAIAVLAGAITLLSTVAPENALQSALAMSTVMLAMSYALSITGKMGDHAMKAVGVLAVVGLVVGEIAIILGLMNYFDVEPSIETAVSLSILLLSLSAACTILAAVGPVATMALVGAGALAGVVAILGAVLLAIGGLMSLIPDGGMESIKQGLADFFDLFAILAEGIGKMISSFAAGIMSSLPEIGKSLSDFWDEAGTFIDGVANLDESILGKVGILAAAIIALSAADLMAGISAFLSGGDSFSSLGTELSDFMRNAEFFLKQSKLIDEASMVGVKMLAETIMILTAADMIDGLTSWLTGGVSFADFGTQLGDFGKGVKAFADAVVGIDPESVTAAAQAGKALAEMAKALPAEGGLMDSIFGTTMDLSTFSIQIVAFGAGMKGFSDAVAGVDTEAITKSAEAGNALAELANALPAEGGLMDSIFGSTTSLDTFGTQLVSFGTAMKSYSIVAAHILYDAIDLSVPAAQSLVDLANTVPEESALWGIFGGNVTLETFGKNLVSFGTSLQTYATTVAGLQTEAIQNSVIAAQGLVDLTDKLHQIEDDNIFNDIVDFDDFGGNLVSLGESLNSYAGQISGLDVSGMQAATDQLFRLANIASNIAKKDFTGVDNFVAAIWELGDSGVTEFISAFTDAADEAGAAIGVVLKAILDEIRDKYDDLESRGKMLMIHLGTGIKDTDGAVTACIVAIIGDMVDAAENEYDSMYDAGVYLVSGFCAGISDQTFAAEAKAAAMAEAAKEAAEEALGIESPSKEFYKVGDFAGQGFVNALTDYASVAYDSSANMAGSARDGLRDTISRISDFLASGVDYNPTISPVLNLSNVRAGVKAIGGMLDMGASVGVLANLNAINSTMNRRNQNGANDDVIRAIDRLGSGISNQTGDTYNFNGLSYNNNAELEAALQTIMRYMVIEGRV